MKTILFFLLTIVSGLASIKEIAIDGIFDVTNNVEFFQTSEPITYRLRVQYDTDSIDLNPDPTEGLYESDELKAMLDFNGIHIETNTTAITIFSGSNRFGTPSWGFQFGNDEAFDVLVNNQILLIPDYQMYGLFVSFDSSIAPTDELKWLDNSAIQNVDQYVEDYGKIDGMANGQRTRLQDNFVDHLTVQDIPEPNTILLAMAGLLWLSNKKINK